ncbi:hypothetical protein R0J90_15370, partial [Micrococcus sp. SIMBA_144]
MAEGIKDWHFPSNTDGKDISATFNASNGQQSIMIDAVDFEQNFVEGDSGAEIASEVVKLKQGKEGDLKLDSNGGQIAFKSKNG